MIYLAADHAGYNLKEEIKNYLKDKGEEIFDLGINSTEPVDYPLLAKKLADEVVKTGGKGIAFCRTGEGMAIVANRTKGIRAVVCWNEKVAKESRNDNDANVLSLPADYLEIEVAKKIVEAFLQTPFSTEERHQRRISQIDRIVNNE